MVKANAYGRGLIEVAECVHDNVEVFYVSSAEDAIRLNESFENKSIDKRVVCVGAIDENDLKALIERNIELAITDKSFVKWSKNIHILHYI